MPKGISVHVGVNQPDPSFGVVTLQGCVNDANAMFQIAQDNGFEAKAPFLDTGATLESVEAAILDAANSLDAGDIFLFTFAGHGSIRPTTFSAAELDSQDETILLFDCILIDNYLRLNLWSQFKKDVRILGIADSCHSGTALLSKPPNPTKDHIPMPSVGNAIAAVSMTEASFPQRHCYVTDPPLVVQQIPVTLNRGFSAADRQRILNVNPEIHNEMQARLMPPGPLQADLLTLGACQDRELAGDGEDNGVFTRALLDVWDNGAFAGPDYNDFIRKIAEKVRLQTSSQQNPVLRPLIVNQDFVRQRPFTIE